jgi:hypothetical protein
VFPPAHAPSKQWPLSLKPSVYFITTNLKI